MQIQKQFHNLSEEKKQIDSIIDNNSLNSFNFQNPPNKITDNINENKNIKEQEENKSQTEKFEISERNSHTLNDNSNIFDFSQNSSKNGYNFSSEMPNCEQKIDNNFGDNSIGFNPYFQKNDNNNNFENININDENFFNYSFYKKNNNKIINNNYNNKLIENKNYNEIKNDSNEEEMNNIQNDNQPKISGYIDPPKPNIPINDPNNFGEQEYSCENSNSNFRKRKNHKKHFKIRYGDWICPNCENLNFSFRNKCNRCGLSKEKSEQKNNNQIQQNENNSDNQRPIMFNNININYIFNSNFPQNNINIIYNPILFNNNNINNYYGNYNNYQIYSPCNVNIK